MIEADRRAIDELAAAFFDAFTNRNGVLPDVDRLYRLFIAEALIINNNNGATAIYDLPGFIEPRRAMLTDGTLGDFQEEETSQRTDIAGNVAHRLSEYRKAWTQAGRLHTGQGVKSLQLVRTAEGWRISALVWEDVSG